MKPYLCPCGNTLYFENSRCLECDREIGYDNAGDRMVDVGPDQPFTRCSNGVTHGACNWVVPVEEKGNLCPACVLSSMIPDLSFPNNLELWKLMEQAKRHMLYSLNRLELPVVDKIKQPETGLAFEFLRPQPDQPVITGHEKGLITMNLEEADDTVRETNRSRLHEPYRTLLGHFRHEVGHYYWYLWYETGATAPGMLEAFREVFGDERADYGAAMKHHYDNGAPAGWENSHISAYSTMHPWEDWAETWAHYLHICDGLETARDFNLEQGVKRKAIDLYAPETAQLPGPLQGLDPSPFLSLLHRWIRLSPALNAVAQSLGHTNIYPFVLSTPVVKKLHFIHACIDTPPIVERPQAENTTSTPPPDVLKKHEWLKKLFVWKTA